MVKRKKATNALGNTTQNNPTEKRGYGDLVWSWKISSRRISRFLMYHLLHIYKKKSNFSQTNFSV